MNDITSNNVDLTYLTNPIYSRILNENIDPPSILNKDELSIYKKRIFLLTKNFLKGGISDDKTLDTIFNKYAAACINYLKFKDISEIIQEDYAGYEIKKNKTKEINRNSIIDNINQSNNLIMHKKKAKEPKITDIVTIKKAKKRNIPIPQIRDLTTKDKRK
tara:strand:- start:2383 stop:2865 length:483 start_codon:yes stop_codon:yes gene_type:complete